MFYYILCVTSIHQNCLIVFIVINGLYCTSIRGPVSAERVHHYSSSKLKPRFICFLCGILQTVCHCSIFIYFLEGNLTKETMRAKTKFCHIISASPLLAGHSRPKYNTQLSPQAKSFWRFTDEFSEGGTLLSNFRAPRGAMPPCEVRTPHVCTGPTP